MRILLFGKNGQVGWELQRSLAPLGPVVALDCDSRDGLCGDFADCDGLVRTVRQVRPDLIVNAAAYTAVDKAEAEPERAHAINAVAPGVLAEEAQKCGAWLVHYSTDYVFDGSGQRPWREDDAPAPLNVYGRTKRDGELAVACTARHLILRTSWVYAARGANFVRTMLRLAKERDQLRVVADQFGAPTGAELLADVTALAVRAVFCQPERAGLYHLTAAGETSWHGFARHVIACAQEKGVALRAGPDEVLPIPGSAYPLPACRPCNSRLATEKLQAAFGVHLPDWRTGVERMLDEILVT